MLRPEDCIPGTLVECVDASPPRARDTGYRLVFGRIYTVASVVENGRPCAGLWLAEDDSWHWGITRFRLLPDERLEVFRKMLEPSPSWETM